MLTHNNVIHAYAKKLEQLWHKSFTKQHVKSLTTIKKKIRKELEKYFKSVQIFGDLKRQRKKLWRESLPSLFDTKNDCSNPAHFDEIERLFYNDQLNERKMYLSEEIDVEFEEKQKEILDSTSNIVDDEISFIYCDEQNELLPLNSSMYSVELSQSVNRSGIARMSKLCDDKSIQTENMIITRPLIRKNKKCRDDIKSTCAQVSIQCGISRQSTYCSPYDMQIPIPT